MTPATLRHHVANISVTALLLAVLSASATAQERNFKAASVKTPDIRLCISSKHFLNSSTLRLVTPVMLPPGCARTRHKTNSDWVGTDIENDRDCLSRRLRRQRSWCTGRSDDCYLTANQIRS